MKTAARVKTQRKRAAAGARIAQRAKNAGKAALYFEVRKVADLETGEERRALCALTKWDREEMRVRKYHVGTQLRGVLEQSRNPKFHRLTHAIGGMMREHVAGFEHLDAHQALKRLQLEADAFCELELIDATAAVSMMLGLVTAVAGPALAKEIGDLLPARVVIERKTAQSLSFDSMDEGAFQQCFRSIFDHMGQRYFGGIDPEAVALMIEAYDEQHN